MWLGTYKDSVDVWLLKQKISFKKDLDQFCWPANYSILILLPTELPRQLGMQIDGTLYMYIYTLMQKYTHLFEDRIH